MSKRISSSPVYVERALIYSQAFRELTGAGKDIVLIFLSKRQMGKQGRRGREQWIVQNNGQIIFTYDEATGYGITRRRFQHGIDQAIEKGFIDIEHHGLGVVMEGENAGSKDPTRYSISERWRKYGTDGFIPASRDKRKVGFCLAQRRHRAPKKIKPRHAGVSRTRHAGVSRNGNKQGIPDPSACLEEETGNGTQTLGGIAVGSKSPK